MEVPRERDASRLMRKRLVVTARVRSRRSLDTVDGKMVGCLLRMLRPPKTVCQTSTLRRRPPPRGSPAVQRLDQAARSRLRLRVSPSRSVARYCQPPRRRMHVAVVVAMMSLTVLIERFGAFRRPSPLSQFVPCTRRQSPRHSCCSLQYRIPSYANSPGPS
jgi:hypothetical protein